MNNRLFNLLLFTVLIGGLISCKSKNSKPCDYIEYEYAEVTILDILVEEGKEEVKIEVSVDKGALAGEIQYLGNLKKTTFTKASADKNKIKIGIVTVFKYQNLKTKIVEKQSLAGEQKSQTNTLI